MHYLALVCTCALLAFTEVSADEASDADPSCGGCRQQACNGTHSPIFIRSMANNCSSCTKLLVLGGVFVGHLGSAA